MAAETVVEWPALSFRADVGLVVDAQARTAQVIFSTGAAVDRIDPRTGTRYREVLSLLPAHVRLDRLNAGAPLLDSHQAYSVQSIIGVVEPGSARIEGRQALATVRFSKRREVDDVWQDVQDRILRSVSVGYRVHKFEERGTGSDVPTRTAVDWEPFELSLVSMPADSGARLRGGEELRGEFARLNRCVIVQAGQMTDAERLERLARAEARGRELSREYSGW